jgi:hypothetical protein
MQAKRVGKIGKESGLLTATRNLMEKNGWWVNKNHGNNWSRNGLPDLTCVKEGTTVWIELKMPDGSVTRIQEEMMKRLREHGAYTHVSTSPLDALNWAENKRQEDREAANADDEYRG